MISEKGFVLENGTELPFLGFGTWLVKEEKIILVPFSIRATAILTPPEDTKTKKWSATPCGSAASLAESCS